MSSQDLIDAQFDRAVEIVQGLPQTGPIQTGYDEKLTMYSLYKQATVGNVTGPRPGLWDMLGRAKWDAWSKHKDLDPYEAKWLYVGALMKVLRKYSDRTVSADLIQELESYGGDPSNIVTSRTLSGSRQSDSSGSSSSEEGASHYVPAQEQARPHAEPETSEDDTEDEADRLVPAIHEPSDPQINRPPSSVSSNRYRTPMAGSLATSPPPVLHRVPETQPMPGFETPSAFGEPSTSSSFFPPSSYAGLGQFSQSSRAELTSPPNVYPAYPQNRGQVQPIPGRQYGVPSRPVSRPTIEHAIENVQAHLAALSERIESLESLSGRLSRSRISVSPRVAGSPSWGPGRGSPAHGRDAHEWDLDDLGMWSLVVNPVARGIEALREAATFFARDENRSPTLIIVRRLCLDVSFLLCVLAVIRTLWRKSGVRRREVNAALVVLWRAILGTKKAPRTMVDRGV
ncbi:hypothetical protein B0H17DRAFT_1068717 [Mycena rosella]|uniref:ACB domain-containing protein n=1 Tax=Mycena rosella TaxID=1033263 RepID=A0AAD7GGX4_MYCRO|nr:hypothetical protein B0H17DRAFT_1068717 [Mycena rosella]